MFEKGTSFVLSPVVSISTLFKPSFWFNDCIDSTKIDQTQQREGGERAMRGALKTLPTGRKISYINAHGTSTPVGDVGEVEAVRRVFGEGTTPPVSSTKSMTGHSQGATGAHEAIYCLLALQNDFIIPSINVETLDPALNAAEIATTRVDNAGLDTVMTNSFGFGGTNGSMLLSKFHG